MMPELVQAMLEGSGTSRPSERVRHNRLPAEYSLTSDTFAGGTGDGLNENVLEAYNFIANNYRYGDEIFCFGFSRGAYTARAVAGLVTQIGVVRKSSMDHFPALYRLYKKNTGGQPFRETDAFKNYLADRSHNMTHYAMPPPPPVKVVGVWDTVGALGIPDIAGWDMSGNRREHGFHNTGLGPGAVCL
jgi:uncharacterized protein (DUF2235 family)